MKTSKNSSSRKFLLGTHDLSYCKDNNQADKLPPPSFSPQPSIAMGPKVVFSNAIGDPEAQAIVAEWQPRFKCTIVETLPEPVGWE